MKTIDTLIPDIYSLIGGPKDGWFTEALAYEFSGEMSRRLKTQLGDAKPKRGLRLSGMGPKCPRALWYAIHHPELAEALPPWAEIKYAYGHIIEALVISLCKAAGHEVTGEQDEIILDGVVGHRDCIIDGCLIDVKSASSRGFEKFKTGSIAQDDPFGYLDQLDGYVTGSLDDPLLRVKDRGYLLAVDKTLGHMVLYEHRIRSDSIRERIKYYRKIIERNTAPDCTCGSVPDGKSGNLKLDVKGSYNPYKYSCFPSLRTFLYSGGPVYLTRVVRKPDVVEIDRFGNIVYN